MTLLSVSAFAKTHNVSKAAAQKWQAKGYLVMREGKVFVEGSDRNLEFSNLGRYGGTATGGQRQPATGNPAAEVVAEAPTSKIEIVRDETGAVDLDAPETIRSLQAFVEQLLNRQFADYNTASTVKENALALKHVLSARKEAGRLIDLETAENVLFEAARQVRDSWLNFPTRVGPLIAAEIGADSDKLVEALSVYVHQQLEDIGEPDADFSDRGSAKDDIQEGAGASA